MAEGYVRQSSAEIVDGNIIHASDSNNEFNALQAAFDNLAGHTHDTTTQGNGGPVSAAALSTGTPIRQVSLMAFGPLTACAYNNGASGVGATITANVAGALTINGQSVVQNQRIFLAGQSGSGGTGAPTNGIYSVTVVGDGVTKWVLTRASDFNVTANIFNGVLIFVSDDLYFNFEIWQLTCTNPVTVGVTNLFFVSAGTAQNFTGSAIKWQNSMLYSQPILASVNLNASPAITLNTWTKVPFDTVETDISQAGIDNAPAGANFDKTTNHRYTPQVSYTNPSSTNGTASPTIAGMQGWYRVAVTATLAAGTTIGAAVYKNGSQYRLKQAPGPGTITCETVVHLNGTTDYIEGFAFSSSTTTMTGGSTATWMDIQYLGSNSSFT